VILFNACIDLEERLKLSNSKYTVALARTALDSVGVDDSALLDETSIL